MSESASAIRTFPITSSGFTAIVAPINCDYYAILGTVNGAGVIRSSDPNNANAQHTIGSGGWYALVVPKGSYPGWGSYRFKISDTVTYAKSAGIDDLVIVEFIC
jgi:hypothetical protein